VNPLLAAASFAALIMPGELPRISESVAVGLGGRVAAQMSATALSREALNDSPSFTLDQKLGATPGFSLFRRSSSRTANPTTQGVTLRGLSASGASRTLVMFEGKPLNDPFGGWVYWNRVPAAAIEDVQVTRGGSSDLYGSDAMAGAIHINMRDDTAAELRVEGGSQDTGRMSVYGGIAQRAGLWGGVERSSIGGYIPVEPSARGAVDTPAASRYTSAVVRTVFDTRPMRIQAGGSYLSEHRNNGTVLQTNGTRVVATDAALTGEAAGGVWDIRADFSAQDYDQTFSAVAAGRATERLTNVQHVDTRAARLSGSWMSVARRLDWLVGATVRHVDADLIEGVLTSASQRSVAAGGNVWWRSSPRFTLSAGVRGELWESSREQAAPGSGSSIGLLASRVNATARLSNAATVRVSASNAYRTPTINELYRGFRVGDITTRPNPALDAEDAWGGEAAVAIARPRVTLRAVAFATWQNGTIYSRTVPSTRPGTLRMRDNGDARSTGVEIEAEGRLFEGLTGWAAMTAGESVFTSGELEGNRLPQAPRASASAGLRILRGRWVGSLEGRYSASQFDDDRNTFELSRAFIANALASARFARGQIFASVENLFDAEVDAGRTPLRTLAQPRMWQAGVRVFTR